MSGFWSYRGTGTSSAHSHDLLVHSVLPFGLESHGIHEQHTVASTEVKEVSGLEETLFLSPDGSEGSSLEVTVEVEDPVGATLKAPSFDGGATCGSPLTFRDRLDEEVQLSQKSWWKQRLGIDLDETHPHDAWVGQGARLGTDDGQLDETEQHMVQEVLCRVAQCKPRVPGTVDARQLVPAKDSSGISPHMRPAPWSPTIAVAPRLRTSSRASRECIKLAVEQQGHTSDVKAKILRGSVRHPRPTPSVPPSPAFLRRMEARATCRKESRDKLLARSSVVMTSNMSSLSSSPSPYTASASSSRGSIPFREIASAVQSQMRDFCTPELTAELLHLAEHFRACEVARQVLFAWRKKRLQILARRMSRTADEMAIEHNNICTKMFQSVTETHWRLQYAHLTQDEEVGRLTVLSGEMSERTAIVRYHRKTAAVVLLSERTQRRLRTLLRWYFVLWVASTEERRLQQAAATYRNFLTECAERSVALMMHEHV